MLKRIAVLDDDAPHVRSSQAGLEIKIAGEYRTAGGLNRIMQWLNSDKGFMTLSSFRASNSFAKNKSLFTPMPGMLRNMLGTEKVGAYWLIGHWMECSETVPEGSKSLFEGCRDAGGKLQDSLEYSWFFLQPDDVPDDKWMHAAVALTDKFNQDSFICRLHGESGSAGLYGKDGEKWTTLSTANAVTDAFQKLAWMRAHSDIYGYSELRKLRSHGQIQPIVFTTASKSNYAVSDAVTGSCPIVSGPGSVSFYVATPHNNSARAMFAQHKIRSGA